MLQSLKVPHSLLLNNWSIYFIKLLWKLQEQDFSLHKVWIRSHLKEELHYSPLSALLLQRVLEAISISPEMII